MAFPQDEIKQELPAQLKYIQDNYIESFNFLQAWKRRKVRQLVLFNNLQRGDENIASTLLLTLFTRVLSSLYDDKLQIKFLPSQGITQDQINSYNTLAQSDYLEMDKPKIDYDWAWDSLFFNRGYVETSRFNKRRKIMEPQVINPLVFGYDPYFEDIQDWRYYWKWITVSKTTMQRLIKTGAIDGISKPEEIMSGVDEYLWNYKILRDRAKKAIEPPAESSGADIYQILEYYGYDENGDKCCYWIDRGFSKVLSKEKLKFDDLNLGEDTKEKGSKWPLVIKEVFREPHASINFGIADLLEDKHRAKSVLLNLAFIAAKDKANPIYQYNPDKVKDVTQLFSRQINQHIPVEDVTNSIAPLNTQEPLTPELTNFISMLQQEANAPIGTGVALQPQKNKTSNTATEAAIDQQLNDMAQSLQSKIMQFGESEFWSHWFHRYAKYGPDLEEKIANIVGVKGVTSKTIDLKDFNADFPPGVFVYSAKQAEYKELVLRRDLMQLYPALLQTLGPDGMRNFNKYVFFPKFLDDPSLVDTMLPETIDEMKAKAENEQLANNELVEPAPTDDHAQHIYVHHMVQPKTWAVWFHIQMHEKLLSDQKAQQQIMNMMQAMPPGQSAGPPGAPPGQIQPGAERSSPMGATTPLQSEIKSNNPLATNNQNGNNQ